MIREKKEKFQNKTNATTKVNQHLTHTLLDLMVDFEKNKNEKINTMTLFTETMQN
jgi:hypothetical protein